MTGVDDGLAAAAGALPRRLLCATRVNAGPHSKSALIDWWHLGMLVLDAQVSSEPGGST